MTTGSWISAKMRIDALHFGHSLQRITLPMTRAYAAIWRVPSSLNDRFGSVSDRWPGGGLRPRLAEPIGHPRSLACNLGGLAGPGVYHSIAL
ncbi:MAG: hypothetical protein WBM28_13265, partial [Burkholderiales bacterium]